MNGSQLDHDKDMYNARMVPKITNLSSFTQLQVFPNLYEILSSVEHKKEGILKNVGKQKVDVDFHSIFSILPSTVYLYINV